MTASPAQSTSQPLDLLREQNTLLREVRASLQALEESSDLEQEIVLTEIDIPFSSLMMFMLKWTFASIPAFIIIGLIIGGWCLAFVAGVIGSLGLRFWGLR